MGAVISVAGSLGALGLISRSVINMDAAMAAAQAAAEAALYETATQEEMQGYAQYEQQYNNMQQQQQQQGYAGQQERGYLEALQQNPDQLGMQANLLQEVLGSSSAKDHSTDELLHLLAQQQQGQQQNSTESYEQGDSMEMRPDEHYMTIAQDGRWNLHPFNFLINQLWYLAYNLIKSFVSSSEQICRIDIGSHRYCNRFSR